MVKRVVLGTEAVDYIRHELARGRTLARDLLSVLPASSVVTFVPEDVPEEDLTDFEGGCLGDTWEAFVPVLELAEEYLRAQSPEQRYLICEDTFASRTDPYLAGMKGPFFTHDDDVYFFLPAEHVSADQVRRIISAGGHYPWIAVLTSLAPASAALRPHSEQSRQVLQALASRAEHVFVAAYDEEGWLLWSR
jgi:hypothetical protein